MGNDRSPTGRPVSRDQEEIVNKAAPSVALGLMLVATIASADVVGPVVGGDNIPPPGHCTEMPGDPNCSGSGVVTVPEPGSLELLLLGGAVLGLIARRRFKK